MWMRGGWICALVVLAAGAHAQAVLKVTGEQGEALRLKTLVGRIEVDRGIAKGKLTMTFQSPGWDRQEGELLWRMPDRATATGFAYWFEGQRVQARVLETERAKRIYERVKAMGRDPALIDFVGKTTLRAKIFPLPNRGDLQVEVEYLQPLDGGALSLPIRTEKGVVLDSIDLTVAVPADGKLFANLGMVVAAEGQGQVARLKAEGYRPQEDLLVRWVREPVAPRLDVLSARSGGTGGFFVLCLTPARAVADPRPKFRGVPVTQLHYPRMKLLAAGQTFVVTGRYPKAGSASVNLDGNDRPFALSGHAEPNHPGVLLWAAAELARLGKAERNRKASVALSLRHNLPGGFTSWLAIPASELLRLRQRENQERAYRLANEVAQDVADRKQNTSRAIQRRRALEKVCAEMKWNAKEMIGNELQGRLYDQASEVAQDIADGRSGTRAAQRRRDAFTRICREWAIDPNEMIAGELESHLNAAAETYGRFLAKADEGSPEARKAWTRLDRLAKESQESPGEALARNSSVVNELVEAYANELIAHRKDGAKAKEIAQHLSRLTKGFLPNDPSTLSSRLSSQMEVRARNAVTAQRRGDAATHAKEMAEVEYLASLGNLKADRLVREIEQQFIREDTTRAANALARALVDGQTDEAASARKLYADLRKRWTQESAGYEASLTQSMLWGGAGRDAVNGYLAEVEQGRMAGEKARSLEAGFLAIGKEFGVNSAESLRSSLLGRYQEVLYEVAAVEDQSYRPVRPHELEARLRRLAVALGKDPEPDLAQRNRYLSEDPASVTRRAYLRELRRVPQDKAKFAAAEKAFRAQQPSWHTSDWISTRLKRLQAEVALDLMEERPLTAAELAERARLKKVREELRARMGDPLVTLAGHGDALRVAALMPWGDVLPMAWNPAARRWEGRYDIPTHAQEGTYTVRIVAVGPDGRRTESAQAFHVDLTRPQPKASVRLDGDRLTVRVEPDEQLSRVSAVLPWGERIELARADERSPFLGVARVLGGSAPTPVRIIALDRAHNRTEVQADLE